MGDISSVWPSLFCTDPRAMITFLTRAFGFTTRMERVDGDIVRHAEPARGARVVLPPEDVELWQPHIRGNRLRSIAR